jgi:hypothetical protein
MSAIADVVLADGQATPVNKTFSVQDCTSQLATWEDRTSGIGVGMPAVTLSLTKGQTSNKVVAKVVLPVMKAITGSDGGYTPAAAVAYQLVGKVEIVLPTQATLQNRKDILAFTKNFLANAFAVSAVQDFARPF